ncbi:MAG TPA: hypothetical protein VHF27_03670 [Acidimicrobiales bacterium]|nr:hypothetical protein [Acidimicrobiales bacterium]
MKPSEAQERRPPAAGEIAGRYDGVVAAVGLAVILRLLIERRSIPGVTQDSLIYVRLEPHAPFAPFSPTRPSGYPLVMRFLDWLPGSMLDAVTAAQHAAGVAIGVLVYLIAVRAGVRRWIAVAAAAVPLFDAYTVALEQAILAETSFTLAVVAAAYLALDRGASGRKLAGSGLLLGLACTIRTVGLLVVPLWLAWLLLGKVGPRRVLAGLAGAALPVVAYCTMHAVEGAGFGLVEADGWYLYGKVAPIADCAGADVPRAAAPLCVPPAGRSFEFYLYDGASPAHQLFSGGRSVDLEEAVTPENNGLLRRFSLAVIRAHPVSFVRAVAKELVRYLGPSDPQNELSLYGKPGTPVALYERWLHMPWWLVPGAMAAGTALVVLDRRAREAALLVGIPAALVLAAAATSGFNSRYLLPGLPLLAAVCALAGEEALTWWRSRARPSR